MKKRKMTDRGAMTVVMTEVWLVIIIVYVSISS